MRRSFNAQEARDNKAMVERETRRGVDGSVVYVLNGRQRFHNGYLQRLISIKSLIILSTMPPLDELQRFKQARVRALRLKVGGYVLKSLYVAVSAALDIILE